MTIPSTMTEQIEQIENMEISYRVLHPELTVHNNETNQDVEIPFSSLLNKYRDYLSNIVVTIILDDEAQAKYRFKPKLISNELYGTTELWDTILILNSCARVCDFQPVRLKLYDPAELKRYINNILIIEGYLN